MWHSGLSCHMECQHSTWVQVYVLDIPLLIQLPTNMPGKAAEAAQVLESLPPMKETLMKLLASVWSSLASCRHLGSEPTCGRSLSASPSNSAFQIKITFTKRLQVDLKSWTLTKQL